MDLERNIQNLFDGQPSEIDAENFLTKLHKTRETRLRNKQRLTYSVSSLVVVFFSFTVHPMSPADISVTLVRFLP